MSVGTAFHPRTFELNTKMAWGEWAGYWSAAVYADFHDIEYSAIREAAAVIDTSPLYKYVVSGPDATRLLDRVLTRDASKMQVDQVIYTPWCDEHGKVLDDGTVTRLADQEYRITAAGMRELRTWLAEPPSDAPVVTVIAFASSISFPEGALVLTRV